MSEKEIGMSKKLEMAQDNQKSIKKEDKLKENLKDVKNIYLVMSGKGGVGKSTVAAAIAAGLAVRGNKVGIIDCDMHGPSIPAIFGISEIRPGIENNKIAPIYPISNLSVMSIGFLLEDDDQPVIWRGPVKSGAIRQFFEEVEWGNLDYLIVDLPPGTGDEPLGIAQMLTTEINGAIIVTIPQDIALKSVRKSLTFLEKLNIKPYGIVKNMDGLVCPKCNEKIHVFGSDTGSVEKASEDYNVPVLAKLPLDPEFSEAEEKGEIIRWMMKESAWKSAITPLLDKIEEDNLNS